MQNSSGTFWRDRPVLVTGGTGLVGSWLVKRLVEHQADVTCLIRDWVPESEFFRSEIAQRVKVVRGCVEDQTLLERVLGEHETDTVFHLAAQTIVTVANRNPISTFESNIKGTWCALEAAHRSPKVKQFILASSDKAYGTQAKLPYDENTPLQGEHPYDVSKSCADLIAQSYAKSFGVPVAITRCGNFFGGGDLNWNRIVPGTIRSVLRGEAPVIRSDGKYIRDYFYVEDGAATYMYLAEKLSADRSLAGQAFNFSNDQPLTVFQVVSAILEKMGTKLKPTVLNQSTNEIREQYLSSQKAREQLGWRPLFTLDEGLGRTIEWYRKLLS